MTTRRQLLTHGMLASLFGFAAPGRALEPKPVPWRNWSGHLSAQPAGRMVPTSEAELSQMLATTSGPVRPVGSAHSFSPLVPTDGHLVVLDELTGLLSHDAATKRATFGAGTRLGDMGSPLAGIGQAMPNLPDIDRQTLAGATATATHGTGIAFEALSGYVTALRLVTAAGTVMEVSRESDPALFNAARVSLGALGVVTQMTLQNRDAFRLKQSSWVQKTEEILRDFDTLSERHRHFEMFPLTHSDYAIALATDETNAEINNPTPDPEEDAAFDNAMRAWMTVPPGERRPLINQLAEQIGPSERVDASYKILANVRNNRFNEMEYSVPLHAGAECLREILATVSSQEVDVVFPLEYRYVKRDDTWLSMSAGDEDHAAISIHRVATHDFAPYFDAIEPIFWKYGGRPHWGKVHSLGANELATLYPHFADFQALRKRLDPTGRLLNAHLRHVFGA